MLVVSIGAELVVVAISVSPYHSSPGCLLADGWLVVPVGARGGFTLRAGGECENGCGQDGSNEVFFILES